MELSLSKPSFFGGSSSLPVQLNIKARCALIWINYISNMCLQFSVDYYLLQALGWALTEYGESLQSVITIRFGNEYINGSNWIQDMVHNRWCQIRNSILRQYTAATLIIETCCSVWFSLSIKCNYIEKNSRWNLWVSPNISWKEKRFQIEKMVCWFLSKKQLDFQLVQFFHYSQNCFSMVCRLTIRHFLQSPFKSTYASQLSVFILIILLIR